MKGGNAVLLCYKGMSTHLGQVVMLIPLTLSVM